MSYLFKHGFSVCVFADQLLTVSDKPQATPDMPQAFSLSGTATKDLQKLVDHVGIDISKLNNSPVDSELRDISDLQGSEWESCATKLGLSTSDVDDIKEDYKGKVKEQRFRALKLWKQQKSFMATYKELAEVFISQNRVDLAVQLCKIINLEENCYN